MANNFFTICSFFYSVMLSIIYFKKKNIATLEAKVYSYIVCSNLFTVVFAILCYFTIINKDILPITNLVISKLLLVAYLCWSYAFTYYIYVITKKDNDNGGVNGFGKFRKSLFCSWCILTLLIFYLPLYYYNENRVAYSYGPSANVAYGVVVILVLFWVVLILRNFEILKSKKCIPIILFIILASLAVLIQRINPGLLLTTAAETFITVIMYFTIENPDKKMLDEVHKAKTISDNSNEEKTMFLYNMTNEIRNITKDIDISADEILDEADSDKANLDAINDSARNIKGSTAKFTTMTNEILDISNMDAANIKIYNEKYNIKLILKELVTIYKSKADKKGISFRTEIASDVQDYLYGDSVGVKSVLTTILDNSIKYTEKGYIEFRVNIVIKNNVCRLVMVVEDSGVGMKADDIDLLFNKHKSNLEKNNLKKNLYTAKKVITLMGGTLIPSSSYGTGTMMKIVLDQKIAPNENSFDNYEYVFNEKKILVVDDSETSVKIIEKCLNGTNINMEMVSLGKECLDRIRNKEKFDLILVAEEMSPIDGIEVMKKLKDIRTFNTDVILLSKNKEYEYNDEYKKYGFSDIIIKPIDKNKFLEKIDKYLK